VRCVGWKRRFSQLSACRQQCPGNLRRLIDWLVCCSAETKAQEIGALKPPAHNGHFKNKKAPALIITLTISVIWKINQKGATCLVYTNSQRNKNVLKALLKELTESLARMSAGSWFQALGPATANDRAPKYVTVGLMTRSPRVADRSLCLPPTDATGWHRSARYVGASTRLRHANLAVFCFTIFTIHKNCTYETFWDRGILFKIRCWFSTQCTTFL